MSVLWWIRRDIRLTDNLALVEASKYSAEVIPVYILDKFLLKKWDPEARKIDFLFKCLSALDTKLRQKGSRLIIRAGNPIDELRLLMNEFNSEKIIATDDHTPYSRKRDHEIQQSLPLILVDSPSIFHPASILKADGTPYTIFTPYSKNWKMKAQNFVPKFQRDIGKFFLISDTAYSVNVSLNDYLNDSFLPGEENAQNRLNYFTVSTQEQTAPIFHYNETRDRMDLDQTSKLSPYIRLGILSPRQLLQSVNQAIINSTNEIERKNVEVWLNELIWRDFYIQILYHYPDTGVKNFRNTIRWINNEEDFHSWQAGRTGYPIVDAGIRQLIHSGWMHNRARMIVASFLTKDLLIDWKYGDKFFMEKLIDGDPAANHGGWQWVAGTGTDAAPYFRIFNPIIQSRKFDPDGIYIRKWVPELIDVPFRYIHEPWLMPENEQKDFHCIIGSDYPKPIIDHHFARERALNAYGNT